MYVNPSGTEDDKEMLCHANKLNCTTGHTIPISWEN
jgi:hypothetical protein